MINKAYEKQRNENETNNDVLLILPDWQKMERLEKYQALVRMCGNQNSTAGGGADWHSATWEGNKVCI